MNGDKPSGVGVGKHRHTARRGVPQKLVHRRPSRTGLPQMLVGRDKLERQLPRHLRRQRRSEDYPYRRAHLERK